MKNTEMKVGILNYGAGNFGSVRRAIEALKIDPIEVSDANALKHVERLIFPGVGSAQQAMAELKRRDLVEALQGFAHSGRPLLGICVGMQVLGEWSEEGDTVCLGLLPFKVEKFQCDDPIPHMGWNSVAWSREHPSQEAATVSIAADANFYFVHSYAAFVEKDEKKSSHILGVSSYGGQDFCALVASKNIWGAQCHIEKSGRIGLRLIENFLCWEDV
ncbi:MAG: imidazole glycerol phosphate synthase subunit HisH [Betaproteobacteria bacterium]|nr:imidazole glycerol phosphate synthase subunit HisH [Betaproteobacteria bacterium]